MSILAVYSLNVFIDFIDVQIWEKSSLPTAIISQRGRVLIYSRIEFGSPVRIHDVLVIGTAMRFPMHCACDC